ncbi:alpha/beta hydrolase [Bifidobacterium choloepi]|uniref:Esterase n=1 Tax=Bifidobacterium choloepi TaxID=2614131 RepID=A0A6I5N2R2_9BIFI|nr:alpha/beta fold hydrolase [Bifidobacterium choloepi]NEG69949.1 esterase [Bifidobacterium choloepi]
MSEDNELIGGESAVVPGRFGEPLDVPFARFSRGDGAANPRRPLFVLLHGWGSNEDDLADIMQYVAPYNDFVALRAPLTLQNPGTQFGQMVPGAYSWLHDAVPTGADLDRDAYAAATAVDRWVGEHVPADRAVVPLGFSQGGMLAIQLLRINPTRYRAAISLSGFLAPGQVAATCPGDDELAELNIPTFFGYGEADTVIPKYMLFETVAWLEEHTWLTERGYRGLDHSVSMQEFADLREWLLAQDLTSGLM